MSAPGPVEFFQYQNPVYKQRSLACGLARPKRVTKQFNKLKSRQPSLTEGVNSETERTTVNQSLVACTIDFRFGRFWSHIDPCILFFLDPFSFPFRLLRW